MGRPCRRRSGSTPSSPRDRRMAIVMSTPRSSRGPTSSASERSVPPSPRALITARTRSRSSVTTASGAVAATEALRGLRAVRRRSAGHRSGSGRRPRSGCAARRHTASPGRVAPPARPVPRSGRGRVAHLAKGHGPAVPLRAVLGGPVEPALVVERRSGGPGAAHVGLQGVQEVRLPGAGEVVGPPGVELGQRPGSAHRSEEPPAILMADHRRIEQGHVGQDGRFLDPAITIEHEEPDPASSALRHAVRAAPGREDERIGRMSVDG